MAAVLYWRLPELTPSNPGPLPWLPGIPPALHDHPAWGAYLAKRSQLVTDLATQSKTTPGKVTPSQSGHLREATRAPPSSAKSQYGGPPTASIPKTRDQPEEAHSKRSRHCGNNASSGLSRVPPTRQQMRGSTSDRQDTPHLDAGTTTASARTKIRSTSERASRTRRSPPSSCCAGSCGSPDAVMARSPSDRIAAPQSGQRR
jgi:hypothetical protein